MDNSTTDDATGNIAIIGMAGRFPGAKNVNEFWENLKKCVESIRFFSDEELRAAGIDEALLAHPDYVKAKGVLDDIAGFDAAFFGFTPKEAEITDPQQRLFLECAWEALENAGYDPKTYSGDIGIYGSVGGFSTYQAKNLLTNPEIMETVGDYSVMLANDKDFLCTRVAYKLNLSGPAVTVQTACSSSLVSVVMACQSLLHYQCDMLLVGGAGITMPAKSGYLYQEGMILSPDGHCRAFDAKAKGTVSGNGAGIVLLKRLEDALTDGDHIYAVIKGSHISNDASAKVSYTAPSVEGQAKVIEEALAIAEIDPETITYVAAHGTGTSLGDPIEIAALTQAFNTELKGYCAIGSVKTNLGHLDAAAGITNLITAVLALKHQLIPPSLHFETPNPEIDFANSPFYVNTELSEWKTNGFPRRAGVSAFGVGGTNAHVVLEESPVVESYGESRPWQLLVLSAKTDSALETATTRLVEHLKHHPNLNLADVAYTYQVGRQTFNHRLMLVCKTVDEAIAAFSGAAENFQPLTHMIDSKKLPPKIVFMFSGQGAQYVNMGLELYQTESVFREHVDYCAEFLKPHLDLDLRIVLYPEHTSSQQINQTAFSQLSLFVIEYALAKLWMSWGIQPTTMIGHSIGEYVAACLAGVFTLDEALILVAARGRLMQSMPSGTMLAVPLSEEEIRPLLNKNIDLAVINVPSQSVVSVPTEAIEQFTAQLLAEQGLECKQVHTSHAFHSEMMSPILTPFLEQVQKIHLKPPQIPYISNVTGTWISATEATVPNYWVKHLRQTVRFAAGLQQVLKKPKHLLLEVGPGRTLSTFAKRHPDRAPGQLVLSSLRHPKDKPSDSGFLLNTLGLLWLAGIAVDWSEFYANERHQRLPLPTYPFEHQRYWVNPQKSLVSARSPFSLAGAASQRWKSLVEVAQKQAQHGISEFDNPTYQEKYEWLDRLCAAYVNLALQDLGAFSHPADQYSIDEFLHQFHILPFYRQMLPRCLEALVQHGQLQQHDGKFTNFLPFSPDSINALLEEVKAKWTDTPQWVEIVQCCGEKFAAILIGEVAPRELLFTGPTFDILQNLYKNMPEARYLNTIVPTIVQGIVTSLPPSAHLRILEIGAGTGSATTHLLPKLPPQQTSYTFSDVGSSFLEAAQHKFSAYPFIQYRRLDIEQPPEKQGYESYSFDVIIAANVLHATLNLEKTLQQVSSLLAPEGFLLLWETTTSTVFHFDVAFPILQPFETDKLRSRHPFLTAEEWHEALLVHGFVEVATFPKKKVLEDHILVAQAASVIHQKDVVKPQVSLENLTESLHHEQSDTYVAPRDDTEQMMADIWQKSLGIERVSIHDDFFELGGDSLIAVQLVSKLRKAFQVELSSHSLLKKPTIATLAKSLKTKWNQQSEQTLPFSLVEIQVGNPNKLPLFLAHPAGGHVYVYRDLASALGPEQPVYGLQAASLDGKKEPYTQMENIAAHFIEVLQIRQPEGPYMLGGSSFGGAVVFEMAQQLHALGQKVALLFMIDTPSPNVPTQKNVADLDILALLMRMDSNVSILLDQCRQLEPDEQLKYFLVHGKGISKLLPDTTLEHLRYFIHLFKTDIHTLWRYIPQTYQGGIIYFRASEQGDLIFPPSSERGWADLATGGVEVYEVLGNHFTMNYSPHVEVIAKQLRVYLNEIDEDYNGVL